MSNQSRLPFPGNKLGQGDSKFLDLPVMAKLGKDTLALISTGGAIIFETSNGPFMEYTPGRCSNSFIQKVYRTHLSEDVWAQMPWMHDPMVLAQLLLKYDNLRAFEFQDMCSDEEDPAVRAECLIMAAEMFGWELVDDEPLELSRNELKMRWFGVKEYNVHLS